MNKIKKKNRIEGVVNVSVHAGERDNGHEPRVPHPIVVQPPKVRKVRAFKEMETDIHLSPGTIHVVSLHCSCTSRKIERGGKKRVQRVMYGSLVYKRLRRPRQSRRHW